MKGYIPLCDKAYDFLSSIEQQFLSFDKTKANILITRLVSTKYMGKSGIHEHIMEMRDITMQLKNI